MAMIGDLSDAASHSRSGEEFELMVLPRATAAASQFSCLYSVVMFLGQSILALLGLLTPVVSAAFVLPPSLVGLGAASHREMAGSGTEILSHLAFLLLCVHENF